MRQIFDRAALLFFSSFTRMKGYRFSKVETNNQHADADKIYNEGGFKFPDILQKEVDFYKKNTLRFIAYYNNMPVGTVSLANPRIVNRPYELHGIDENATHYEIQSLLVSKDHRECSQMVFLGLIKEIYLYSVENGISSWISSGMRNMYLTLRRYNKNIKCIKINKDNCKRPLASYLYDHKIVDTCSIMNVEDFKPTKILIKFLKKQLKKRIK